MQFPDFDTDHFLRDYWQKRPLLIRNPWKAWRNPLAPDELAGLACEDEIESRLITQGRNGWKVKHGPLSEARFAKIGKKPWTLLVQAVDHYVPDVAALIAPFRFIPNWRIDDVMVSYAADGGGVGPHFDHYDVFLIQGLGTRRWQIGARCNETTPLLPHDDLRLLANFEATEEWVLEPGDILYVPPGIAHNGVAVGDDCMTYSVGFRAPSSRDLIEGWCDDLLEQLPEDERYADPDLHTQDNSGEISGEAVARLHAMITSKLQDGQAFARWFGQYSSARKYPDVDWLPEDAFDIEAFRASGAAHILIRNPASRFSFYRGDGGATLLFVDGESFECSNETAAFAEHICGSERLEIDPASLQSDAIMALVARLFDQGSLTVEED
ncbi:MAG: JmjC domain-containing protein [Sphingobium sp.]